MDLKRGDSLAAGDVIELELKRLRERDAALTVEIQEVARRKSQLTAQRVTVRKTMADLKKAKKAVPPDA